MENLVSPLIKPQESEFTIKPLFDDPYAYVSHLDELTRHEFHYLARKVEEHWITEKDIQIARFVFVHRWVTFSQISRLFFAESAREKTGRKVVDRLLKYGLLRRLQWASHSLPNQNKPTLYELGDGGADLLKHKFGLFLGHRDPRHPKPTTLLFRMKYVVTNELYIHLRDNFDLVHFEFHPPLRYKDELQVPTARYILRNPKGKDIPFYLICHREDDKWVKTIRHQAAFFKEYLANEDKEATLVIHVSTDEKAILASKIIEQEGAGPRTWYVTDNDIFQVGFNIKKGFFFYQGGEKMYYDLH